MWLVSIDTVNWFKYMGTTTDSKLNFTGNVDLNCKKKNIYIYFTAEAEGVDFNSFVSTLKYNV